jgi:hypothetical protein
MRRRPYADLERPARHLAEMPSEALAKKPWLLLMSAEVLVSPFPTRKNGPNPAEVRAIQQMQQRLGQTPVAIWIAQDGQLTPQKIPTDVLMAKARQQISIRLPPPK